MLDDDPVAADEAAGGADGEEEDDGEFDVDDFAALAAMLDA
jgi:hypothetical protein